MTADDRYGQPFWEARWSQVLSEHGDRVSQRPPNAHLTAEVGDLRPGHALDAGCGHGSDTLWLAARRWRVTAIDFAAPALARGRSTAGGAPGPRALICLPALDGSVVTSRRISPFRDHKH